MRILLLVLLACALAAPVAVASDFEHPASSETKQQFLAVNPQRNDKPNDPDYDQSEASINSNLYDERFDLFGFPSIHTPTALYKDTQTAAAPTLSGHAAGDPMIAGFNAAGAWKLDRGRPSVGVAVLDTGITWSDDALRDQIKLNGAELPAPTNPNGNGYLDVDDYANQAGLPAKPTAEDLIKKFSDGVDDDHNGYVDDIAGWDFFDDDNDPADTSSYFAANGHGTGRAKEVVESGNDGQGSIGVCPHCQLLPLRVWDTFVSDQTTFGLAMLYATDRGVKVIEGADGGLYHSAFTERASDYAYTHGVAQVFSGDDLNTGNHNYPANYSHTMLIQGTVADTYGLGKAMSNPEQQYFQQFPLPMSVGGNTQPLTLFRGAGTTQYGGHSSVSMIGATGSENTGKAAGATALVYSAALGRSTPVQLTADEAREIIEGTAEDVTNPNTVGQGNADYATTGWDPHFGWGRVNLGDAVQVAQNRTIPPEAAIWSPDWYAPVTGASVAVTGRARARFATGGAFHYKLEWGAGETPTTWTTAKEADGTGEVTDLGTLDLNAIRTAVANNTLPTDPGEPTFSLTSPNPYQREFTVRLTVTADGATGVDRRIFTALDDGTIRPAFPKRMGAGGEAPIRYADLNGDNKEDLIVPLEDGTVHAYDAGGTTELPGFPVHTDLLKQATGHTGAVGLGEVGAATPPREPPRAVTVADLDGDGLPELITTAGRNVYVWETNGTRRAGFPVGINPANCDPADEKRQDDLHHRKCGFIAPPAVAHLEGKSGPVDIVAPALDGFVYAFRPDGASVPHFPKALLDPSIPADQQMHAESINAPAIGDLDGDGADDIVVASNESYGQEQALNTDLLSQVLEQAGGTSRLYAISGKTGAFLPGWPAKLPGAIQSTLPFIGPGHDATIMTLPTGDKRIVASTTGSASIRLLDPADPNGSTPNGTLQLKQYGAGSNATDQSGAINLFESAVVGDLLGTGTPDVVKYGLSIGQVVNLLLVGQNQPYNHLIEAFDATTTQPLPAYPRITDDYQFLSSSTIAKVVDGTSNQVIAGTGLGLLHAYDGLTGLDVAGFPKVTGGWLFSPAALDDAKHMAGITREGYLFEWDTAQPACQPDGVWPSYRHDDHGSGNTDTDGIPPGTPANVKLTPVDGGKWKLDFTAPGDDRLCGTPKGYVAHVGSTDVAVSGPGAVVDLPGDKGTLVLGAVDEAGNKGIPASVDYDRSTAPPVTSPTPGPTTTAAPTATSSPTATTTATATPTREPTSCTDTRAPNSVIARTRGRHTGVSVAGTAHDVGCAGIKRVSVAIKRKVGHGRCRFLRRDGTFGPKRLCSHHRFIPAKGLASWTLTVHGKLPKGRYVVQTRARDKRDNLEDSLARVPFRLRA